MDEVFVAIVVGVLLALLGSLGGVFMGWVFNETLGLTVQSKTWGRAGALTLLAMFVAAIVSRGGVA